MGPIDETLTYARRSKGQPGHQGNPDQDFKRDTYTGGRPGPEGPLRRRGALANANEGIPIPGMDVDGKGRATDSLVDCSGDHR